MQHDSIFRNISPFDHRYYRANEELFNSLREYISEEASVRYCTLVEGVLLKTHLRFQGRARQDYIDAIDRAVQSLDPSEVYREEELTQHHIKALVNVFKNSLPAEIKPLVHLGATSADILDSAAALRMRDLCRNVLLPQLIRLEEGLVRLSEDYAHSPQVGRTHGQYAVPVTLGYSFAEYLSRLGKSILEIELRSADLRGKLSGAVGAYNAMSMLYPDPVSVERHFLGVLGLRPSDHSTQLVEPEHQLRLMLEFNTAFGIIANMADDLRHLQRSEIDEVREEFSEKQVGSSTMPQKRNPWNCEHVKSLWKAFAPRIVTMYMDQISEHQRDLSNSASARFVPDYVAGFSLALDRMTRILDGISVNEHSLRRNMQNAGSSLLAEAAYILLSYGGESNAHEIIRRITLSADENNTTFYEALKKDSAVFETISSRFAEGSGENNGNDENNGSGENGGSSRNMEDFFADPAMYRGRAPERALELSSEWREKMNNLKKKLG